MKSLQRRLNRGLALILIAVFALHWLVADRVIRYVAETQMETRLEHDGDALLANLTIDANDKIKLVTESAGLIYRQPYSGHYFVLQIDGQRRFSGSLSGFKLEIPELKTGNKRHFHTQGPKDQPLLALLRAFTLQGQGVNLLVAEDLSDITRKIFLFRASYLACTVLVLLVAIGLQSYDVRRSLRPLTVARKQLEAVAKGQKPQIEACSLVEIEPLINEINRLLHLVERRLQQSRTAIGNLAHALKTPLAVLYRIPDNPLLADHPEIRRELHEQTGVIQNRIERELKRARLSGNIQAGSNFNPHIELTALTGLLDKIYADKQLTFELSAPNQLFPYDREDMLELLGNLADNACKWASSKISVEVSGSNNTLTIRVADDGPGVTDEQKKDLTQRGLRLDESQPGHGLGLAIVDDIVAFYGGELSLKKSLDLGGLEITVYFKL